MSARGPTKSIVKMLDALKQTKNPFERLESMRRLSLAVSALEHETVADARRAGLTWTEIGAAYGMSKQAAQRRFRRHVE